MPGGVGVGIAVNNAGLTNGKIPRNALVDIGGGNLLRSDAATQFNRMRAAYKRDTGRELGISSAYRDYAWQQRLYNNRGSNRYPVAKPGKSKHGWGLAVDVNLPGNDYNNPTYKWLTKNAKQFGFHTIKGDPVHWQYGG